jgi:hypothetical protein
MKIVFARLIVAIPTCQPRLLFPCFFVFTMPIRLLDEAANAAEKTLAA